MNSMYMNMYHGHYLEKSVQDRKGDALYEQKYLWREWININYEQVRWCINSKDRVYLHVWIDIKTKYIFIKKRNYRCNISKS